MFVIKQKSKDHQHVLPCFNGFKKQVSLTPKVGDGEGLHPGAMCKDTRGTVSWMSWKADNTDLGLDVSSSATQPLGLEEV